MKDSQYKYLWSQIWYLGPIFISSIILTCLILYRLIKSSELSDDQKKTISYYELVLSFISSFIMLFFSWMGMTMGFYFMFSANNRKILMNNIMLIFMCLIYILLSPFGLTLIRVSLQNFLTENQKNIISYLTLPSIAYATFIGTRMG